MGRSTGDLQRGVGTCAAHRSTGDMEMGGGYGCSMKTTSFFHQIYHICFIVPVYTGKKRTHCLIFESYQIFTQFILLCLLFNIMWHSFWKYCANNNKRLIHYYFISHKLQWISIVVMNLYFKLFIHYHRLKNNTRLTRFCDPTNKKSPRWRHYQSDIIRPLLTIDYIIDYY